MSSPGEAFGGRATRLGTGSGWKPDGGNPLWVRIPPLPLLVWYLGRVCVMCGVRGVVVCTAGCELAGDGSIPFEYPLILKGAVRWWRCCLGPPWC